MSSRKDAQIKALQERIDEIERQRTESFAQALREIAREEFVIVTPSGATMKARAAEVRAFREEFGPVEYSASIVLYPGGAS